MENLPVTDAFADYVNSMTNLDALENMTKTLDRELMNSQRMMTEIRSVFDSLSTQVAEPVDNTLRHEDLSKFLEADVPNLLLPDMTQTPLDVDLDHILTTMKGYAEDLKKNMSVPQMKDHEGLEEMKSLDLDQYASSLDQLGKRLANMKLSKKDDIGNRNLELEGKLSQLCEDVNMFTKMVQAKTKLSECNKNWSETPQDSNALQYDGIIGKLLSGINEVTYLLHNKN